MLRATARLVPALLPRAEAAVGTRSMSMAGLKGAWRGRPGLGAGAGSRLRSLPARLTLSAMPCRCRL